MTDAATTDRRFTTTSGIPLKAVYTAEDVSGLDREPDLGRPGSAPYTRGPYPEMYRTRPWRIFQLSGYGLPEDERERIRFLLERGGSGFIMEPDLVKKIKEGSREPAKCDTCNECLQVPSLKCPPLSP